MSITFSADLDVTAGSTINQIDRSYWDVLWAHLDLITFSIPPLDELITPLFTGLSTQEFPYEEITL